MNSNAGNQRIRGRLGSRPQAAAVLFLIFCFLIGLIPESLAESSVSIGEKNNNQVVTLAADQVLYLCLPGNPTTGYTWSYQTNTQMVKELNHHYTDNAAPLGAGGLFYWQFKLTGSGPVTLNFEYKRSWEKNKPAAKTYTVTLVHKKAVTPLRIYQGAFPAQVAFSNQEALWLLDGSQKGAAPVKVSIKGRLGGILGWSPDGKWLAYLVNQTQDSWSPCYLWVVKANGTGACQVSSTTMEGSPEMNDTLAAWSPRSDDLAYITTNEGADQQRKYNLNLTTISDGKLKTKTLIGASAHEITDFTWFPDGKRLAVALAADPRAGYGLEIKQLDLENNSQQLYGFKPPQGSEGMYTRAATGLTISPDGRFLAFYLEPNSASLTADGTSRMLIDLTRETTPVDLGTGLTYRNWMAWSSDSKQLAFINGGGREATIGKSLGLIKLPGSQVVNADPAGQVITQPVWTKNGSLLLARGAENLAWEGTHYEGVLVPGQRIWLRDAKGKLKALTSGPASTADYYPMPSSDGQTVLFLRLSRNDTGSLYSIPLAGGKAVELLRGVTGEPGYYGNYYPEWVKIYWQR